MFNWPLLICEIIGVITFFGYKYCYINIIKSLTPVHIIFSNPILYFVEKIFLLILTRIKEGEFFINSPMKYVEYKYFLDILSDFFSCFGFLIYLEIIKLKGFDYNVKENMLRRSFGEISNNNDNNDNENQLVDEYNDDDIDENLGLYN